MIQINTELCVQCGSCVKDCFSEHLALQDGAVVTTEKRCIECGHCVAVCPQNAVSMSQYDMQEIVPYQSDMFQVDSEKLLNVMKFRRTVRQFSKKQVEHEKLEQIIEAGRYSPTGGNRQGIQYVVLEKTLPEITELAVDALYKAVQTDAEHLNDYQKDKWNLMHEQLVVGNDLLFYNAPVVIAIVGEKSFSADGDGCIAASRMELMAHTLGLGCCFNGFFLRAAQENPEILQRMGIDENKKVVLTMAVGYPAVVFPRTAPRKKAAVQWQ